MTAVERQSLAGHTAEAQARIRGLAGLPTTAHEYALTDRLLRSRTETFDPLAAVLRCWIADTKPATVADPSWRIVARDNAASRLAEIRAARIPWWRRMLASDWSVVLGIAAALAATFCLLVIR